MIEIPTLEKIMAGDVGQLSASRRGGTMWLWTIASRAGLFAMDVGEGARKEARELELRARKEYAAAFVRVEFTERGGFGGFRIKLRVIWDVPLEEFLEPYRRLQAAERAARQEEAAIRAVREREQVGKTLLQKWGAGTLKAVKIARGWRLDPCDLKVAEALWDTDWKELIALNPAGCKPAWRAGVYTRGGGEFYAEEKDLAWFRPAVALLRERLAES